MELRKVWVLRGPNHWTRSPAVEVEVALQRPGIAPSDAVAFEERLQALEAALGGHPLASTGAPAEEPGTALAHALARLTLLLQKQAGSPVSFTAVKPGEPPVYRVVVEYEEEKLARACLEAAHDFLQSLAAGERVEWKARLEALRDLASDVRLGPSTGAIVRAAQARGIPFRRLNEGSLVLLGQGVNQRRILTAETDRTGGIAEDVAQDKELTRSLLRAVGVPAPDGRAVTGPEDAWDAAEEVGLPVAVKPQFGNHGRGVATNLTTREQVLGAYEAARQEGQAVLVETFILGNDHRLLVVNNRLVAAARREPAQVVGDGRLTIRELIDEVNKDPRRSDGHATVLSRIKLDAVARGVLADQGYTADSVPPAGARVLIRRNGNLSTGGTATDVTDAVHPEVAARAIDAARVVGLDIAGVDVVAEDISRPLEAQGGAVVEVNAGPGLRMHLEPSSGEPRPAGEAIIDMLFPPGQTGRIPVVAVSGVNGKTTTTRLIAHLLRGTGKVVGMACTDGVYLFESAPPAPGRRTEKNNCSGPRSARAVLINPRVEAAVLETARGGILREGLGFDQCDVAVITNIGKGDHLKPGEQETVEDLARVKQTVVEAVAPAGTAVLNAADPLVAAMAERCPGAVTYFAGDAGLPLLARHRAAGGRAVFVRGGAVVLADGEYEEPLTPLAQVPMTHGGRVGFQVENVLAAAGAAWALGLPLEAIRSGLSSFFADPHQAPARFNVLQAGDATVVVDYPHNTSAVDALVEALDQFPQRPRSVVFTGCSRGDADHVGMGKAVGNAFDRVFLCAVPAGASPALHGYAALLRQGLAAGQRVRETIEARDEREAIEQALGGLRPGELLVLGADDIDGALAWAQAHIGRLSSNGERK